MSFYFHKTKNTIDGIDGKKIRMKKSTLIFFLGRQRPHSIYRFISFKFFLEVNHKLQF